MRASAMNILEAMMFCSAVETRDIALAAPFADQMLSPAQIVRVSMSHVVTVGSPQLLEPALSGGVGSPFAMAARRVSINMIAGMRVKSRRSWTCDQASICWSTARTDGLMLS